MHLDALRRAGKIHHIGVTNFDVPHLEELLEAGVPVVANQVQYSLLDHRPEAAMVDLCRREEIALLCYGTLAGGFLSERYLGLPEPQPPLENRSLVKYKLIIDEFGGWALFQELLACLARIGARHSASLAAVASRYVLQKPQVAAAIVGSRHARHLAATLRVFDFCLDDSDLANIEAITGQAPGPAGAIYGLERVSGGSHAAIMRYDLSRI
jgi:aryl-alcohol dehydrogenase-like predicted oxidoreductase